ncbi:response regulator [bacterium]|jgi:CheY-like chemotaxis protein|nr:response regulator [bacterium]
MSDRVKTVLIVDDTSFVRTMIRHAINPLEIEILEAENGRVAEEMLSDKPEIDLVILDVVMPVQDGIETLRNLREQKNTIPVIMLTAKTKKDVLTEAVRLGISAFIGKPFEKEVLRTKIQTILGKEEKSPAKPVVGLSLPTQESAAPPEPASASKILRVLIVDPLAQFSRLLSDLLECSSYEVSVAEGFDTAATLLKWVDPNVILVNIRYPEKTEPQRFVAEKRLAGIDAVLIGYGSDSDLSANPKGPGFECAGGFDAFCPFPFGLEELVDAVERTTADKAVTA